MNQGRREVLAYWLHPGDNTEPLSREGSREWCMSGVFVWWRNAPVQTKHEIYARLVREWCGCD